MEKKFKNVNQDRYKIRKSILKLKLKHLRKRTNKKHTKSFEMLNRIAYCCHIFVTLMLCFFIITYFYN